MGWNPHVLAIVADRLAQPATVWRPYAPAAPAAAARKAAAGIAPSRAASSR